MLVRKMGLEVRAGPRREERVVEEEEVAAAAAAAADDDDETIRGFKYPRPNQVKDQRVKAKLRAR
jgi:hypothetical protein